MHDGPKTFLAFFSYGDVKRQTHSCWMRDMLWYSRAAGFADAIHQATGRSLPAWSFSYFPVHPDALIERSRSVVSEEFLKTDCEVMIMLDHDMTWEGPTEHYEGDLLHLARKCAQVKSIVGGLVAKKAKGQGAATMFKGDATLTVGQDGLCEVWCPGSGLTAYHRDVVQAVMDRFPRCAPGFRPGWMTTISHHPYAPNELIHMSEDWAFVERAMAMGFKAYSATKPIIGHIGDYEYKVLGDAYTQYEEVKEPEQTTAANATKESDTPALVRSDCNSLSFDGPGESCAGPLPLLPVAALPGPSVGNGGNTDPVHMPFRSMNIVLPPNYKGVFAPLKHEQLAGGGDAADSASQKYYGKGAPFDEPLGIGGDVAPAPAHHPLPPPKISMLYATRGRWAQVPRVIREWSIRSTGQHKLEWIISADDDDPGELNKELDYAYNIKRIRGPNKGCVDAYNRAAYSSTGQILVQVHDDVMPPPGWDKFVVERIGDYSKPAVLHVSDGLDERVNRKPWLICILICTRAWARACGWFWCPEYTSLYCDDDASQMAMKASAVVMAKDIVFKHDWGGHDRDETQRRSYSHENWMRGEATYQRRAALGFPAHPELWPAE